MKHAQMRESNCTVCVARAMTSLGADLSSPGNRQGHLDNRDPPSYSQFPLYKALCPANTCNNI